MCVASKSLASCLAIRLGFQRIGPCSGGFFSPTSRLDASSALGHGRCCAHSWQHSRSFMCPSRGSEDQVCSSLLTTLPLFRPYFLYVNGSSRASAPSPLLQDSLLAAIRTSTMCPLNSHLGHSGLALFGYMQICGIPYLSPPVQRSTLMGFQSLQQEYNPIGSRYGR